MRILFFIHGLTGGGAERVLVTLANEFVERGEAVCIYCLNEDVESPFPLDSRVEVWYHSHLVNNYLKGYSRKIKSFWLLRNAAKRFKADVVISFITLTNIKIIQAMVGIKIPIICCEHTTIVRKFDRKADDQSRSRKFFYPLANVVTVLTKYDYSLVSDKHNTVRMPNPYIPYEYTGIEKREKVVLAAGRVKQWKVKGFDNLLRSWSKIWKDYPEWRLHIAGDYKEEDLKPLMEIINKKQIKNVDFLGFRNDIHNLMLKSEVFCLSSRVEGLPMVLLEAMNARCACVAFNCKTGPSEIIIDEVNGLLAKELDIDDLSMRLRQVMDSEDLRNKLRENVILSMQKYALNKVINRWYILFKKMGVK